MDENEEKKGIPEVLKKYSGAIIGGLVAFFLCFTELYKILISAVVILAGIVVGNYVQKNKETVKEKLKEVIDKF